MTSPLRAIGRARVPILTMAATYTLALAAGIAMVHEGSSFALERRDAIVAAAQSSAILVADRSGDRLRAALLDFASNLGLGGVTSTLTGIAIVGPYPIALYRGWVGGIVSVDGGHQSRLGTWGSAAYYLVTVVLQLIPYSIAGGVGVRLGLVAWRGSATRDSGWFGLPPSSAVLEAVSAYAVIAPLFLAASLFEFLIR